MLTAAALLTTAAAAWLRSAIRRKRAAAATIQRMAEARLAHYRRQDIAHAVATATTRAH